MSNAAEKLKEIDPVLEKFKQFEGFSKALLDAYAIIDTEGKVLKSNQLFSVLVGKKSRQILKADSLDELLSLSVNGKKIGLEDLTASFAATRIDEITGVTETESDLNLIMGIYPLHEDGVMLGLFLLIRDVTAEAALQGKYRDKATQSITDNLTGLYNRTFFDQYLPNQIERIKDFPKDSAQRDLTLMMLDIDFFKKCNDTYGHQAGDYIIAEVAEIFKSGFRKTDIPCRYGGEEFLAILPATDLEGARVAAEKIRKTVEEFDFVHEGVHIPIRISIGVARIDLETEDSAKVIARADAALYFSKDNGRNKVSVHHGNDKIT